MWRDQEDDRLAAAVAATLTREDLTTTEATGWLDPVQELLAGPDETRVAARVSNTLRTLRALHVLLATGVKIGDQTEAVIPPHAAAIQRRLVEVLHHRTPWMW